MSHTSSKEFVSVPVYISTSHGDCQAEEESLVCRIFPALNRQLLPLHVRLLPIIPPYPSSCNDPSMASPILTERELVARSVVYEGCQPEPQTPPWTLLLRTGRPGAVTKVETLDRFNENPSWLEHIRDFANPDKIVSCTTMDAWRSVLFPFSSMADGKHAPIPIRSIVAFRTVNFAADVPSEKRSLYSRYIPENCRWTPDVKDTDERLRRLQKMSSSNLVWCWVNDYNCQFDNSQGIHGLETFEQLIFDSLVQMAWREFSSRQRSSLQFSNMTLHAHSSFALHRTHDLCLNSGVVQKISTYVSELHREGDDRSRVLEVLGGPFEGKTATLCAVESLLSRDDQNTVIAFFPDADTASKRALDTAAPLSMLSRLLVHIACALFPGNNVSLPLSKATPAVSLAEALQVLQHLIQSRKNAGAEAISPVSSVDFDSDDSESLRQPPSSPMGSKRLFLVLDDFDYVCSQPGTETPKPNSRMIPLIKRVWDLLIGSGVFHGVVLSCSTPSFLEFLRDKQTHPSSVVRVALPRPSEGEVFSVVTTLMERNCSYLYCEDDSTSTLSWPPQQLDSSAISGITRAVVRSQLPIPLLHVLCALAATFPPLTRSRAKAIADANADLQATFSLLLDRVVQVIGKEAQMFLGLLSVSRNGLSEDEIVYALYELREATIAVGVPVAPPAVTALRDIFDEILVSSVDGRFQVLPAVRLAAMKRCVPSTEDRYLLHGGLADLFTRQCLRGDGRWRIDHPRAMRELSYHLCRSSRTGTKVLGRLLADPAFLFAKALACGMDALAEDFMDAGLTAESARTTDTVTRSVLRSAWMVLGGSASSAVRTFLPALSMALTLQLTDTKFTLPLRPHESQKNERRNRRRIRDVTSRINLYSRWWI
eukprot:Rmarinus@m.20625